VPDDELPTLLHQQVLVPLSQHRGVQGLHSDSGGTSYRSSDIDIDIGGAPTLWQINGRKVVGRLQERLAS